MPTENVEPYMLYPDYWSAEGDKQIVQLQQKCIATSETVGTNIVSFRHIVGFHSNAGSLTARKFRWRHDGLYKKPFLSVSLIRQEYVLVMSHDRPVTDLGFVQKQQHYCADGKQKDLPIARPINPLFLADTNL